MLTTTMPTLGRAAEEALPARARAKLDLLLQTMADARDLTVSARRPLDDIANRRQPLMIRLDRRRREGGEPTEEEAAELADLDARHEAVMAKVLARDADHRQIASLVAAIRSFLGTVPTELVDAPPVAVPKGATLAAVRAEVDDLLVEIAALAEAPIAIDIAAEVARMAERGRPTVGRRGEISFKKQVRPEDLAAWLDPAAMEKRLRAEAARPGTISAEEKATRLAKLRADLIRAERIEEHLVSSSPVPVARRRNASPEAVLGIAVRPG